MSADYTDGYNDGYAAAESRGTRDLIANLRKTEKLETLLKAAAKEIEAYGEDEGYTPSRVVEEVKLLTREGWL